MAKIIKWAEKADFCGCDFVLELTEERKNTKIKLLQITDMQFIDAKQARTPDRLRTDEINAWLPDNFDIHCADQIRSLVAQTAPDLIFITGDFIYGSFDDTGSTLDWFCNFMDSLMIPWAPVFGNHDNESARGVEWQCARLESSKYCVFRRGEVSGNSNYSIGIRIGGELVRVLYMLDSNGCRASTDESVIRAPGIYPDQLEAIRKNARLIKNAEGKRIPAFMAFHIPSSEFAKAEVEKGYKTKEREFYTIGVDVVGRDGDYGCKREIMHALPPIDGFSDLIAEASVDGVFCGHCHSINTVITHEGVKWVFGLKTGQYDYHNPGQLGGTLVCLEHDGFEVRHIPALTPLSPYPGGAKMFNGFFAEDKVILK